MMLCFEACSKFSWERKLVLFFFKIKLINQYLGKFSGGIYNIGTWTFIYIFKDAVAKLII